ncbi:MULTISPECIES: TonB-dependent receptor plug domain-containing protein [Sphingomonadales]|jgi:vitamin B12 transporter|uniref:TonB-dependent receptor n=2 Tax=Sphingomonadaceae TaxID=41297 RepID=A0A0B8ZS59_9SPHN|nr:MULTISPECIES: TonB-dependent receptor [Sphingomonadales]MAF59972.1 TonB-dependent receptor [Blastomonas sp.]MCI5062259.1 TonB-dependent receptor [Algiphilus sp.]KHS49306.1 TonB-dependent receptor [Novosphingobium subterraneum]KHS49528.1 TonB-dependent receptor [Novosphingobium subterraneum]KTE12904.1 TonB-dependent receptor [Sphingopyxis sp. H115]|tara:strand:+ start:9615 stop:11558 length:1944 start_codon:yes stop_codon:yes gene_type:complete
MKKPVLVSTFALALASCPAFAQSNPGQPTTNDSGETIVVTASRSGEAVAVNKLGASVTVLDSEALEQRQTRIVSDILRDVPGVAVSRTGAAGGLTQLRLRGSEGNHVLVLIDGIEASDPYFGEFDFATLIADPEARVEVLRGQQSSLYGSDAIGGVIQYLTLTGKEAPGVSLRAEGGSFNTFTGSARAGGVSGDLDYAVSGAYYHTGGYPTARNGSRDVGSDIAGLSAKLIWSPSETFKLTGVARYSFTEADTNNSENNPASPLFGFTVDSPGVFFRNKAFYGLVRAELIGLDGRWTNAVTGQVALSERKGFDAAGFDYGNKGNRYKGSFESSLRLGTDAIRHRLTAAIDVEREEFQNTTPSSFAFQGKRSTDNVGIVGQYELLINDAFSFGASIRHDENDRFDDPTTWRVQGSYSLPTGTRVRGAYGTGVKNPGYFELYGFSDGRYIGNPNLRPEKSEGWEAGIEQSFSDGKATISATYFDSRLKDEIFTTFPAPTFIATPSNRATLSKQHGIEVALAARPIPQIRLDAAYTWLHARENGTVEVRRPKHIGSFNATVFSKDERFSGTLTVRYNGRQTDVAFTNPSFIPVRVSLREYVLVNLNAEYKLRPNISLFARVENLINEQYEEVFSFATPGRAGYGGVRVRF